MAQLHHYPVIACLAFVGKGAVRVEKNVKLNADIHRLLKLFAGELGVPIAALADTLIEEGLEGLAKKSPQLRGLLQYSKNHPHHNPASKKPRKGS